ncbi:tetratricopeptide repeat protein [Pedobacter sp. SD-b]|uniref:Tetratricopeptide repeat protein n=1 Tax=Pedobacter segetis TaxID=2793069 RepID=A0ABS1BGR9_9SPHI|nr:tetratricopeptide repeat protein [Pedobacter segetis]MBK0382032.1 tetratricopeptide repeat protein [Pedobacter segetis]
MSKTQIDQPSPLSNSMSRTSFFIEENKKSLLVIGCTIIGLVLLYFAYQKFYLAPRETEAVNQMFKAQQYWEQKDWDKAIKGDGNFPGFEKIIDEYDNTKSANLAYYYLGIAYLNKGEYQKAAENLTKYSGSDPIIAPEALGAAGDAYVELKNYDNAITFYKKAVSKGDNLFAAPIYLKKLGLVYEEQKDFKSAVDTYTKIKSDYPESATATNIDMYIARAEGKL